MQISPTLYFVPADEMNQANEELRDTIRSIWPLQAKKMLDLLIPRNEGKIRSSLLNKTYFAIYNDRVISSFQNWVETSSPWVRYTSAF